MKNELQDILWVWLIGMIAHHGPSIIPSLLSCWGPGPGMPSRGRDDKNSYYITDCVQMASTMSSYVYYVTKSNLLDPSENAYFDAPARVSVGSDLLRGRNENKKWKKGMHGSGNLHRGAVFGEEWLNNSWFDNNALQISEGSRGDVDVVVGQDQSWLGVLFHYCFLVFPSKCLLFILFLRLAFQWRLQN